VVLSLAINFVFICHLEVLLHYLVCPTHLHTLISTFFC
jgi:hypothetical protein